MTAVLEGSASIQQPRPRLDPRGEAPWTSSRVVVVASELPVRACRERELPEAPEQVPLLLPTVAEGSIVLGGRPVSVAEARAAYAAWGEALDAVDHLQRRRGWGALRAWLDAWFGGAVRVEVSSGGKVACRPARRERAGLLAVRVARFEVAFLVRHRPRWSGLSVRYAPGCLGSALATTTARRWHTSHGEVEARSELAWRVE